MEEKILFEDKDKKIYIDDKGETKTEEKIKIWEIPFIILFWIIVILIIYDFASWAWKDWHTPSYNIDYSDEIWIDSSGKY